MAKNSTLDIIRRLMILDGMLAEGPVSVPAMHEKLSNMGFQVNVKTVRRDLELLETLGQRRKRHALNVAGQAEIDWEYAKGIEPLFTVRGRERQRQRRQ
jgi:hypothetical protein